jgi:hypothetical protein
MEEQGKLYKQMGEVSREEKIALGSISGHFHALVRDSGRRRHVQGRVLDPYSFFQIWIRIQSLMLETNTDPDPIRIQGFNDQKLREKKLQLKFIFIFYFLSKTAIYLSLGLRKVCPSYIRSLQFSKEAIQHFKT